MSDLKEMGKEGIAVADIKHFGDKMIIPEGMTMVQAISLMKRRQRYLEEETEFSEVFEVFPWDGANALVKSIEKQYGWATSERTPGMFGSNPPSIINIACGPKETIGIPWGRISIPGVEGYLETGVAHSSEGTLNFRLEANILRKDEEIVRNIIKEMHAFLDNGGSIYTGKAIQIRFRDEDGDRIRLPEPVFMDLEHISRDMLIYSDQVQQDIETNLFTPIERMHECLESGIPVKRGVLLGGPYGTGKTLAATVAAKLAIENGLTFIYIKHADELNHAIQFAKQYQSPKSACVVFCEDIDRAVTGERTVKMDDILNILDGIDTKAANIITVLTTNHMDEINPAMMRPGRLDAIINVLPPDKAAVVKLLHLYAKGTIDPDADLSEVSEELSGAIPAVVAEVVKRAKLAQLGLQLKGTIVTYISAEAVLVAAKSMRYQVDKLNELSAPKVVKDLSFKELVEEAMVTSFKKAKS